MAKVCERYNKDPFRGANLKEVVMGRIRILLVGLGLIFLSSVAWATNGDRLISSGGAGRSMGGVGIAMPLDSIGAIFSNPAAICSTHCFKEYVYDLSTTFFMPTTKFSLYIQGEVDTKVESDSDFFVIPAFAVAWKGGENLRYGLGIFGVSGMGVDYRDSDVDRGYSAFPMYPYASGIYTQLQSMKIAPNVAVRLAPWISVGFALNVGYSSLDMNRGTCDDYPVGFQVGTILHEGPFYLGLVYMSPQKSKFKTVADFDSDGELDTMQLESPEMLGIGLAYTEDRWLVEFDLRYYNWDATDGYGDFGWRDQLVYAIGVQYILSPRLTLRLGYNHGKSPLRNFSGFDGTQNITVQGKTMKRYYYETFRITGFPAIAEDHFTVGLVYTKNERFSWGIGVMYSPEETIEERGTDAFGNPVRIKSSLREVSVEVSFQWKF